MNMTPGMPQLCTRGLPLSDSPLSLGVTSLHSIIRPHFHNKVFCGCDRSQIAALLPSMLLFPAPNILHAPPESSHGPACLSIRGWNAICKSH